LPRYFFDIDRGRRLTDEDGEELPDPEAACRAAVIILSELLRSHAEDLQQTGPIAVRLRDADGRVLRIVEGRVAGP
jgi:hypothetical protein